MSKFAKLMIYEEVPGEKIYVTKYKALEFEDFLIITYDPKEDVEELLRVKQEIEEVSSKSVVMIPDTLPLSFYGVKEDDGSVSGELQHPNQAEETA